MFSLVITPFWATIETDMPVEIWKQLLDGTDVMLVAGLEFLIRAFSDSKLFQTNSLETVRGAAISYLARGVDRIYLFNYMDSETTIDDTANYWNIFNEVGNLETLKDRSRRHVLTYPDTWAPGEARAIRLPEKCIPGQYSDFRIHIGPRPDKGKVSVILGISDNRILKKDQLKVLLNGEECSFEGIADLSKPRPEGAIYSYNVPLNSVLDGYNIIEVLAENELEINWVEIYVYNE